MKNKINISNLTPEQIEDLRQQLKAFDEQPKSIMDKVKSWEDAKNIVKPEFWISSYGAINNDEGLLAENHVPSEKHAKSILATSQLMVIAEALNEGSTDNTVSICWDGKSLQCSQNSLEFKTSPIEFKNLTIGKYAMTQFEDLWYDYFMIDKPKQI